MDIPLTRSRQHDYKQQGPTSMVGVAGPLGPLMGGPQCRLSILRNGNVPCRYFSNVSVDFKIA